MKEAKSPLLEFIKSTKTKDSLTLEDSELYPQYIDTGVYVMNGVLSGDFYGGMETSRTTELIGESASGKSAVAIFLMSRFFEQFPNSGICYLFETEGRISKSLVELIPDKYKGRVVVIPITNVDELNEHILAKIKTALEDAREKDVDIRVMFVLDSLGNVGTAKEMKDSAEGKNSTLDMKRAQQIKKLFRTITIPVLTKFQIPFVLINHVYDVIGAYVPTKKASGGSGPSYLSNNIIDCKNINDDESKSQTKMSAFRLRVAKSMTLAPKTEVVVYLNNGVFSKYSYILKLAEDYKVIKTRNAGSKGKVFMFGDKEYTKADLRKDEKIMDEIVRLTNEAWKTDKSFMIKSEINVVLEEDPEVDGKVEVKENEELTDEELTTLQ